MAAIAVLLAWPASASAQPDAVQGVERQVVDVTSRAGLTQKLYATYLNERLTPGEVIAGHPALAAVWDGTGTHQYGRPAQFFHQLQALNLEHAWSQVSVPTLVMWGDKDIAMHRIDERIVSLVNANKPGAAALKVVANGGHDLAVNGQVPRDVLDAIAGWLGQIAGQ